VRQWLIENGFQGKEGQQVPVMTPEKVASISDRYIELYEQIIGEKFVRSENNNVIQRVEQNLTSALNKL